MADTTTPAAVEAATEVAPAAAASAAAAAGSSEQKKRSERTPRDPTKIIPKPDPVEQPDEEAKNKAVEALKKKMANAEKRIEDIRRIMDKHSSDRKEHGDNSDTIRAELRTLRDRSVDLRARRQHLFSEVTKQTEAKKAATAKLREMQKTLKVGSLAEIDASISKIEYEMSTSTLTAKEEKAKMNEIKQLRQSREQVRAVQSMSASVSAMADVDSSKSNHELIKELDQELTLIRNREKEITTQLDEIRAKYQAGPALPELHKELKALLKQNKDTRDEIRALEQQFYHATNNFRNYERNFRDWKRQQDQIKYEQIKKERDERRLKREAEEKEDNFKETPTHPWAAEIFLCDDLIKFCKSHLPKKESTSTRKTFEPAAAASAGLIPIGKLVGKDDDNEWAGTKTKKRGAKAAEGAESAAAAPTEAAKQEDKKLTLSMDCYSGFVTIGIKPPVFASQCAATIQALHNAKSRFNSLTEADKKKQKETDAAASKAEKEAKKREAKTAKASGEEGVPAAAVSERTGIDFRSAIRGGGVKGAHV